MLGKRASEAPDQASYVNCTRPLTRWRKAGRWRWRIECKLADAWLGVYLAPDETWRSGTVWVCVVPCLPIHIDWFDRAR